MKRVLKNVLGERNVARLRSLLRKRPKEEGPFFDFIATDVTSNCNLRCPFCINDFTQIHGNTLMSGENMEKAASLVPLVSANTFFASCLFEPFLHPAFVDYIEMIPKPFRPKVFFSTSLTLPIGDDVFKRLRDSEIGYINISVDSLDPVLYAMLRRGAKYEVFMNNLQRLVKIFSQKPTSALLKYITMALQDNYKEIPNLMAACRNSFLSSFHEVRFVYETEHYPLEWKERHLLSNRQWEELVNTCSTLPYPHAVVPPPAIYFPDDDRPYSRNRELYGDGSPNPQRPKPGFGLNINSAGSVTLFGFKDLRYDLRDITDPCGFFRSQLPFLREVYDTRIIGEKRKS